VSALNVLDAVSVVGFSVAAGLVLTTPARPDRAFPLLSKVYLALAMLVYVVVSAMHVAEGAETTQTVGLVEDYIQLLFVPLLTYAIVGMNLGGRLLEQRRVERLLRAEHETLQSTLETSPTGIMLIDADGRIMFANDQAREIIPLGRDPDSDDWVFPEASLTACEGSVAEWVSGPECLAPLAAEAPFRQQLYWLECPDEVPLALSISASPLVGSGQDGQAVMVFADVTERVRADGQLGRYRQDLEHVADSRTLELLSMNAELESANNAKRDFLANMSHELRTPLNSIIGFTTILLSGITGDMTDEQRRQLEMVSRSGQQLLALVNDVLDLSRIEAGGVTVDISQVPLAEHAENLVAMMRPLADERGIRLSISSDGWDVVVDTDAEKLAQILRNFLSNAIKFTDPGGSVEVRVESDGRRASLAVKDTGVGIDRSDLGRVFDVFQQIQPAGGVKPPGTGLGLAICRDLAELLGADIGVESEPGAGSTFTILLPVTPPRSSDAAPVLPEGGEQLDLVDEQQEEGEARRDACSEDALETATGPHAQRHAEDYERLGDGREHGVPLE
jgi:signal transduction histidine kinase